MFLQQPVDEDVTAADFAEEDAFGAVVEEARVIPGRAIGTGKGIAEGVMKDGRNSPML